MAMRSGHAMVPKGVALRQKGGVQGVDCIGATCCNWGSDAFASKLGTNEDSIRICHAINSYQDEIRTNSIDDIIRGMSSQTAQALTTQYDDDMLQAAVIGYNYPNANLMQIDLERSKNLETLDFESIQAFLEISPFSNAKMDNVFGQGRRDFFLAGLIESESTGDMGETFATIIVQQFLRLRHADWRWFENFEFNNILTGEAVREISNTTFRF